MIKLFLNRELDVARSTVEELCLFTIRRSALYGEKLLMWLLNIYRILEFLDFLETELHNFNFEISTIQRYSKMSLRFILFHPSRSNYEEEGG